MSEAVWHVDVYGIKGAKVGKKEQPTKTRQFVLARKIHYESLEVHGDVYLCFSTSFVQLFPERQYEPHSVHGKLCRHLLFKERNEWACQ